MKANNIFTALGGVEDRYIEEAAVAARSPASPAPRWMIYARRLVPMAACLVILAASALILIHRTANNGGGAPDTGEMIAGDRKEIAANVGRVSTDVPPQQAPEPANPEPGGSVKYDNEAVDHGYAAAGNASPELEFEIVQAMPGDAAMSIEALTLDAARAIPTLGAYIPQSIPNGFIFESAHRADNVLSVHWSHSYDYIELHISDLTVTQSREHMLPDAIQSGELSLELITARTYTSTESGVDAGKWMARFSVLYGNVLVEVSSKGVSPEALLDMLEFDIPG
ncbi:MAG: hypothetical protein LBH17_01200 [Oscillospiraceae bacterium]|jgi:hypothetical protein|nr:hypothetical protein [Oscillospiraceae bacterium]